MDYQKLVLVGNVTRDAERRTSRQGDVTYTVFSVGVGDSRGRSTFFPVRVFGKQGEAIADYLPKGRQVLVEGRISVNDEGRFNVIADRVVFGTAPQEAE
jgi:single-strand DNA-binding protein